MDFKQTYEVMLAEHNPKTPPRNLEDLDVITTYQGWNIVNNGLGKKADFYCYTGEGKYDWEGPFESIKDCKAWIYKQ